MWKFVSKPNLPDNTADTVIMADTVKKIVDRVEALKIKVIKTTPIKSLHPAEAAHADMQVLHIGKNNIMLLQESTYIKNQLEACGFNTYSVSKSCAEKYPGNVLLNAAIIGETIILNKRTVDDNVLILCEKFNKVLEVKQGYSKCSVAVVSDNAIITSDEGIYSRTMHSGIDVLKIRPGFIELPGFDYGFIGGCCGKLSKRLLAFTGSVEKHPDYNNIKAFAANHHVSLISLSDKPLIDIGGILPIIERI